MGPGRLCRQPGKKLYNMAMKTKYAVFAALFGWLAAGVWVFAQQPASGDVAPSAQTIAEPSGAERDPLLIEKVRDLKAQLHDEFAKKRGSTPEEAGQFRTKAITLSIEYHNMLHKRAPIPLIGALDAEIHELIYSHPKIAAHIFSSELEIYKSTEAYFYKAQAEVITGEKAEAEADLTAAIAIAPEAELLRHRGQLYLSQHKYDQAIEDFSRAIKAGGVAPLYHSRAVAYFKKDDYAGAAEDLEQFFKLNTDKEYSRSVAASRICAGLRKRGFAVEGCAAPENGGEKK